MVKITGTVTVTEVHMHIYDSVAGVGVNPSLDLLRGFKSSFSSQFLLYIKIMSVYGISAILERIPAYEIHSWSVIQNAASAKTGSSITA